jgi:hypothetical protein
MKDFKDFVESLTKIKNFFTLRLEMIFIGNEKNVRIAVILTM